MLTGKGMFSGKQFFIILFDFVAASVKMGRTVPLLTCQGVSKPVLVVMQKLIASLWYT